MRLFHFDPKKRGPFFLSLAVHIAFLLIAMRIFLPVFNLVKEDLLSFGVKGLGKEGSQAAKGAPAMPVSSGQGTRPAIVQKGESKPTALKDIPLESLVSDKTQASPEQSEPKPPLRKTPPIETMIEITEERRLREEIAPKSTSPERSELMKMGEKYKTDTLQLVQALKRPLSDILPGAFQGVGVDPEEGMPGFTPSLRASGGIFGAWGAREGGGAGGGGDEGMGGVGRSKYEALDNFLEIEVATYEAADSQKYYRVRIFAKKDTQRFKAVPKEILFTIDCSLSISPGRLDEFKKGITYCLKNLNPEDVFNIFAFKDKVIFFSKESIPASPEEIKRAERFVSGLSSSQATDVYAAFDRIIRISPARKPSNVMLFSDGRPTHGIVDSRELINSVTRLNNGVRPVFAFSGGAKVNRYLLDFIAYQNRAWAQYIKRSSDIDKGLAQFYDKIRDPLFLDLRYQLGGVRAEEAFPRSLPDFYRNAEFTLYGRYGNEQILTMQLLGNVGGKTKELIFQRTLVGAPKGGLEIEKGYAFNKIYDRISRATAASEKERPALLKEVRDLSSRYGITTPYSPELERRD